MGDLIRRNRGVPVQARRADGSEPPVAPTIVEVPGRGASSPPPPGPAHVTQNVIYVAAPQAGPVPPPQPQAVHHHHHHTTQVILPPRRMRRTKGTSFLGTLGLVVGALACGAAFLPQVAPAAPYISKAGLAMAAVAWLGALLLQRVGATMPFLGMIVSAAGCGLWLYNTGQAQSTYDRLRSKSPVELPAVTIPPPPAPFRAGPTTSPGVQPSAPVRASSPASTHDGTMFDLTSPGWRKPN